jgi:hypothetical protein
MKQAAVVGARPTPGAMSRFERNAGFSPHVL